MRFAVWWWWTFPTFVFAQEYQVFYKNDYAGLLELNSFDTILSPTFDDLGWSNGMKHVVDGTIGFKNDGAWGLIFLESQRKIAPKYYSLLPFENGLYKASIKGKFSNHLFYGLLSKDGDPLLSFSWFDIEKTTTGLLLSEYSQGDIHFGWMNAQYQIILATHYSQVKQITNNLLEVIDLQGNNLLFHVNGKFLGQYTVDTIVNSYIAIEQNGSFGLIDSNGQILQNCNQKQIVFGDTITFKPFPNWLEVNAENKIVNSYLADSLTTFDQWLIVHKNGNQEVLEPFKVENQLIIESFDNFWIGKKITANQYFAADLSGKIFTELVDSLSWQSPFLAAKTNSQWYLMNRFGRKLSERSYDHIKKTAHNMLPVMKNGYWGLVDFQGELTTPLKYEHIVEHPKYGRFFAKFIGKWGVIDPYGHWVIPAAYDTLYHASTYIIGEQNDYYYVWDTNLVSVYEGPYFPHVTSEHIFLHAKTTSKTGLLSSKGVLLLPVEYDSVIVRGEWAVGYRPTYVVAVDYEGKYKIDENYGIQDITGYAEGWYRIKKDNREGYVDSEGRLRVANRYKKLGSLIDGVAAAYIEKGWGLISREEKIIIQPQYDSLIHRQGDLWLVKKKSKWGLIKSDGSSIIESQYDAITAYGTIGYLLSKNNKTGFANSSGQIILQPEYQHIIYLPTEQLLVKREKNWGMVSINGYPILPFLYTEVFLSKNGRIFVRS